MKCIDFYISNNLIVKERKYNFILKFANSNNSLIVPNLALGKITEWQKDTWSVNTNCLAFAPNVYHEALWLVKASSTNSYILSCNRPVKQESEWAFTHKFITEQINGSDDGLPYDIPFPVLINC